MKYKMRENGVYEKTEESLLEEQLEIDKDLIIADLLLQLSEKEQRLSDLELIVSDMLIKGGEI